jgi:hypothetical protein
MAEISEVVVMRLPAETALAANVVELRDYRERQAAAAAAQIEGERSAGSGFGRNGRRETEVVCKEMTESWASFAST